MALAYTLPKNHHLDPVAIIHDASWTTISAIVEQDPDYYATVTNSTIQILYKKSQGVLNHTLTQFSVTGDLVDTFFLLHKEMPSLVTMYPLHIGWKHEISQSPPVWKELPPSPYQHQIYGGQTLSLALTNATARDVLTQIMRSQTNHMYWAAECGNGITVSFFSEKDNMGEQTIQAHDAELMERIRHAQEKSEKGSDQNQGSQPKQ